MVRYTHNVLPSHVDVISVRQGSPHATHEAIRQLLKEQKEIGEKINKDPIFRDYRLEIRSNKMKLRSKGWKEPPRPQMDKDLDAEGHSRVMQLIANAAMEAKKECAGVWAKFGKPYQPLGNFELVRNHYSRSVWTTNVSFAGVTIGEITYLAVIHLDHKNSIALF